MTRLMKSKNWILLVIGIACMLGATPVTGVARTNLDYKQLESIVIQEGGRKKPYSTFALEDLQLLSGRSKYTPGKIQGADGKKWGATEVITAMWMNPVGWEQEPMILISLLALKEALGFEPGQKRFSFEEIAGNTEFQRRFQEIQTLRQRDQNAKLDKVQGEIQRVAERLAKFNFLVSGMEFTIVPNPKLSEGKWLTIQGAGEAYSAEELAGVRDAFDQFVAAYREGNVEKFSAASAGLKESLRRLRPEFYPADKTVEREQFYYRFHPFRVAWILYALGGIVLGITALWAPKAGYRIAWGCVALGFLCQVIGFIYRVLISGRAPVTNMYESVIWVAFGTILFALIFEWKYRCRYFMLGAIPIAVISLILADSQPTMLNANISPLVAVLRDNFWLTTHVLSITLSYSAFALALGVAHIALGKIIFGKKPGADLYNYLYKCLQVGVFLLGAGTLLGAVWANYSWGRFWDWDPKETWALIAFLSYLFILHGRIAGLWAGFGLAVGSLFAFLSVVMAWYGVNFVLGAGLHSYGFGSGGFGMVMVYVIFEFVFGGVAIFRHYQMKNKTKGKSPVEGQRLGVEA